MFVDGRFRAMTDGGRVNVLIGALTTCLMTVRHKRLTKNLVTRRSWSAIIYNNTSLKVEPPANKVTRTKEIEVWYQQYNRRIHGDEQRSRRSHTRTWITGAGKPLHWTTRRVVPNTWVYNKLLEQQTNSANPIPVVAEIMRSDGTRQDFYPESFVRSVQQVEDDAFCQFESRLY